MLLLELEAYHGKRQTRILPDSSRGLMCHPGVSNGHHIIIMTLSAFPSYKRTGQCNAKSYWEGFGIPSAEAAKVLLSPFLDGRFCLKVQLFSIFLWCPEFGDPQFTKG